MTASEYLLRVLRGFVQGEDPGPFDGDWRALLELAAIHSVHDEGVSFATKFAVSFKKRQADTERLVTRFL